MPPFSQSRLFLSFGMRPHAPPRRQLQSHHVRLPAEIVLLIVEHIGGPEASRRATINSLSRASRRLGAVLTPILYRDFCGIALRWAVDEPSREVTALKALDYGRLVDIRAWRSSLLRAAVLWDWVELARRIVSKAELAPLGQGKPYEYWYYPHPISFRRLLDSSDTPPGYWGPVYLAAWMGRVSVLRVMLESKHVDPNVKERWIDRSPLSAAVMARHREAVEVLLRHPNIRPNDRNGEGKSPLAIAVELGEEEIVRLLLQHPAIKIHSADHVGQTPLSRAKALGRDDLVQLLKNRMVDASDHRFISRRRKRNHDKTAVDKSVQDKTTTADTNLYYDMSDDWGNLVFQSPPEAQNVRF